MQAGKKKKKEKKGNRHYISFIYLITKGTREERGRGRRRQRGEDLIMLLLTHPHWLGDQNSARNLEVLITI